MLCTNNPYKVRPFKEIYRTMAGSPLDMPENVTGVLIKQSGEIINYNQQPHSLNKPVHSRFLCKMPRYQATGIFKEPDRYVYSLQNGCIIGQLGLIYDPEKRTFIDESAKEWTINLEASPYTNAYRLPAREHLEGITFSFLTIGAEAGFYHFLFESLSKISMFQPILLQADHLLFNGPPTAWKLKWLNRAGIDVSKIRWVDGKSHYKCRQLIFTNRLIADQQLSNWCIYSLKFLFGVQPDVSFTLPEKIIFISRKGLKARELTWEDDLLTAFPQIERVDLTALNAEETISILQNATHVIGPHGAGLSNIYLCRPGTKVLELYPNQVTYQPCYQRIAALCSIKYALMYMDFEHKENPETGLEAIKPLFAQFVC